MSNGTLQRYSSSVEPHATIGAQDLVQAKPDRCGFLRKRGQKERMLESLHLSRHINWRQRFVVIIEGCCYCYTDEVAKSPVQTFALQGYNRIYRTQSERAAFVFRVEPANTAQHKMHTFAATTDGERIAWMETFRSAMGAANDVQLSPLSAQDVDDMYVELEKPVYIPEIISPSGMEGSVDIWDEEESGSDDSDYDRPEEAMLKPPVHSTGRRNVPLPPVPQDQAVGNDVTPSASAKRDTTLPRPKPPTPGESGDREVGRRPKPPDLRNRTAVPLPGMASSKSTTSDTTSRSKPSTSHPAAGPKPTTPKKPTSRPLLERDCLFDNSDREAAIEIIRESGIPGTFLIRKSRQGDSKVLVVMTTEDVKEYKIFAERRQFSLDRKTFFPSMDGLLHYYATASLPNRQQTLSRPYSSSSDRH